MWEDEDEMSCLRLSVSENGRGALLWGGDRQVVQYKFRKRGLWATTVRERRRMIGTEFNRVKQFNAYFKSGI